MAHRRKVTPEHPEGQIIELTVAEETQRLANAEKAKTEMDARKVKEDQKASDQASGNAKLLNLGLTQAEATALTGYRLPPPPEAD